MLENSPPFSKSIPQIVNKHFLRLANQNTKPTSSFTSPEVSWMSLDRDNSFFEPKKLQGKKTQKEELLEICSLSKFWVSCFFFMIFSKTSFHHQPSRYTQAAPNMFVFFRGGRDRRPRRPPFMVGDPSASSGGTCRDGEVHITNMWMEYLENRGVKVANPSVCLCSNLANETRNQQMRKLHIMNTQRLTDKFLPKNLSQREWRFMVFYWTNSRGFRSLFRVSIN